MPKLWKVLDSQGKSHGTNGQFVSPDQNAPGKPSYSVGGAPDGMIPHRDFHQRREERPLNEGSHPTAIAKFARKNADALAHPDHHLHAIVSHNGDQNNPAHHRITLGISKPWPIGSTKQKLPGEITPEMFEPERMVSNILSIFDQANENEVKQNAKWYTDANTFARELSKKYDKPLETVVGVIAALSPRCAWEINQDAADAVLGGRAHLTQILHANVARAMRIMNGENPEDVMSKKGAPKTFNFFHNILDPSNPEYITIDTLAMSIIMGRPMHPDESGPVMRYGSYDRFATAFKEAAKQKGILPNELQAATWTQWRLHNSLRKPSDKRRLREPVQKTDLPDWLQPELPMDEQRDFLAQLEGKRKLSNLTKGGSGSGDFDHSGRPGEIGGSKPQKGFEMHFGKDMSANDVSAAIHEGADSHFGHHWREDGDEPMMRRFKDDDGHQSSLLAASMLGGGGFTVRVADQYVPHEGFAVAGAGTEEMLIYDGNADKAEPLIEAYVRKNAEKLGQPNTYLGGWVEGDKLYLDTPSVYNDRSEALRLAHERNEISIFDLSTLGTDQDGVIYSMSDQQRPRESGGEKILKSNQPKRIGFMVDANKSGIKGIMAAIHQAWETSKRDG